MSAPTPEQIERQMQRVEAARRRLHAHAVKLEEMLVILRPTPDRRRVVDTAPRHTATLEFPERKP